MMRAVPKIEDLKTKMGTNNELTFSAQGAYCVACSTNGVFEDIPKQECSLGKYVYSTNTQMLKEQKYRYIMSSKVGRWLIIEDRGGGEREDRGKGFPQRSWAITICPWVSQLFFLLLDFTFCGYHYLY